MSKMNYTQHYTMTHYCTDCTLHVFSHVNFIYLLSTQMTRFGLMTKKILPNRIYKEAYEFNMRLNVTV